ncbi:MAG TPA: hypothetical protein VGS21_03690 [Acidimicrobiales bacterium]|nr:hypothetical protein [Acidimicrobiales bacterium]
MSVFALVSAKGAPGVTTLACVLGAVWPVEREVVVAECDPAGGDLAARFGLSADTGMTSLVAELRQRRDRESHSLRPHTQTLPGGLEVLCGPIGSDAGTVLDSAVGVVGLEGVPGDVLVDCGRLGSHFTGQQRIVRTAKRLILLLRPEASSLAHGRWVVERLATHHPSGLAGVALAVAGSGAFSPPDIARTLGVELLGVVPRDRAAAAMLRGEPGARRALARSALVVAAKKLALALCTASQAAEWRDAS